MQKDEFNVVGFNPVYKSERQKGERTDELKGCDNDSELFGIGELFRQQHGDGKQRSCD